jgi:hypothetical protein
VKTVFCYSFYFSLYKIPNFPLLLFKYQTEFKMRFFLSFLTVGIATANLPIHGNHKNAVPRELTVDSVKADSPLGSKLLSNARRLEDENEYDMSWVANYSIKFQGCHHVSQWNDEAEDGDQVRIQTKRLIRFRLCPSASCSISSASGCSSGYGDYIIDMNTFLYVYFDAVEEQNEYTCQNLQNNVCNCADNGEDDYSEEMCLYDCYSAKGVADICADGNPYAEDGEEEQEAFQLQNYVECQQTQFNYRRLEDAEEDQGEEQQEEDEEQEEEEQDQNQNYNNVEYYIGPYCAEQGGSINLGLFLDDTCTTYADNKGGSYTYKALTGESLPYSSKSIITTDCMSCQQVNDGDNDNNNDNNNAYGVSEVCAEIYDEAGKCESNLYSSGVVAEANTNACTYIKGIKVVRRDGIITQVGSKANKTASIFIGIFVVAFVLLAAYVYYLKTKLDRVSINLAE